MRIGDLDYMNKTKGTGGTDGQDVADLWNAANVSEAAKLTEEQQRRRKWMNSKETLIQITQGAR